MIDKVHFNTQLNKSQGTIYGENVKNGPEGRLYCARIVTAHERHIAEVCLFAEKERSRMRDFFGTATGTRTPVFAVRGRRLNRLTMAAYLAAEPGFEPGLNESESFVLPLHNSAMSSGHNVPDRQKILYFGR